MNSTKLYDLLNVSPDCSLRELKKAYKKLSIKYHPDKNSGDDEMFKQIKKAYEVLSNPESRQYYDDHGEVEKNKPDKHQVAISKILEGVKEWVRNGDIESDLVEYVKRKLKIEKNNIGVDVENFIKTKKTIEKVKKRVSSKGENLILMYFESQINTINEFLDSAENNKKVLELAEIMIDDFSWESQQEQGYISFGPTSGTTFTW